MPLPADFLRRAADKRALFARFSVLFCGLCVCNPDAFGETIHKYCGVPSARLPGERTDLIRRASIFAAAEAEAPPHDLRVGRGRCTDLSFPTPLKTTRGEVVPSA